MSNRLLTLAWSVPLPSGPKFLLVALADRADDAGKSWPSREMLCEQTGMSPASVSRHLEALLASGLLTQQRRRQRSAEYVLDERALIVAARRSLTLVEDPEKSQSETSQSETSRPKKAQSEMSQIDSSRSKKYQSGDQDVSICDIPKENPHRTIKEKPSTDKRPDVERLCAALVEHRVRLGDKPPTVTATWRQQARLLIDTDGRPLEEALAVLAWSQHHVGNNGFSWQANIRSLPTFRKQYDALRLQRSHDPKAARAAPVHDPVQWLRDEWQAGRVTEIHRFYANGYTQPTAGDGDYWNDVLKPHNRQWITEHRDAILARLHREVS